MIYVYNMRTVIFAAQVFNFTSEVMCCSMQQSIEMHWRREMKDLKSILKAKDFKILRD